MADPMDALNESMKDIARLLELHEVEAGKAPGRKYGVEVLNKSGVVLALACWEAFVEDCAVAAFDFLIAEVPSPANVPIAVRRYVAKQIRDDKNELAPWALADAGWKTVLVSYRNAVVRKYVSPLNTPSAANVDALFLELLGLVGASNNWYRHKMRANDARNRLKALITLRGEIAHRAAAAQTVRKKDVSDAAELVRTLAGLTSNATRDHVIALVGKEPWPAQPAPPRPGPKQR